MNKQHRTTSPKYLGLLAVIGFATLLFSASPALAQITLGTAQNFAVLGGSTVTNTGSTVITGDVGLSPGSSVTGFPPGNVVGTVHIANGVAVQAKADLTAAYTAAVGLACGTDLTGQNLGGLTLTPGVYCFSSSAGLTGPLPLTLNLQGNPNAFFLFKIASTLTTASSSSIVLINSGGSTCPTNVFFQVGDSATLGTTSTFRGNILALNSITLTTGVALSGRALARNAAVTLDSNSVSRCAILTPADIPVLSPIMLLLLTITLATVAVLTLRR